MRPRAQNADVARNPPSWLPRRWALLLLALVLAVTAAARLKAVDIPLERDEGEYAYGGQLLLQGVPPYEAAYNMKFPGIYAAWLPRYSRRWRTGFAVSAAGA